MQHDVRTGGSTIGVKGRLAIWLAQGLGLGRSPRAPGTFGTLGGLPLAWGLAQFGTTLNVALTLVICLLGIPVCTAAVRAQGGPKDPGSIVLDEIASVPIVFWLLPMTSWQIVAAGFLLHRLFDISKLPPAKQLERLPSGLGIMADDWAAAVYANLSLRLLLWGGVISA